MMIQVCEMEEDRDPMVKAVGRNIRDVRLKKKLTQEQVADLAGIHPKYLGEIERGIKSPTAVIVQKVAAALDAPLCSILSANGCPCSDSELPREVSELFVGKEEQQMKKAVKILSAFFE